MSDLKTVAAAAAACIVPTSAAFSDRSSRCCSHTTGNSTRIPAAASFGSKRQRNLALLRSAVNSAGRCYYAGAGHRYTVRAHEMFQQLNPFVAAAWPTTQQACERLQSHYV
jgi:hypothetical protein